MSDINMKQNVKNQNSSSVAPYSTQRDGSVGKKY